MSYHLSSSTWVTRGWTYQEAILSRRCIFFTKDQVYFACKTHLRSEAVEQLPIEHNDTTSETLAPKLMNYAEQFHFEMVDRGKPYFHEHIKEYTRRSLTFDSDGLNAFNGIISSHKEYTYWGIPFTAAFWYPQKKISVETSEHAFAHSLAWVGKRRPPPGALIRRRKDFPKWSWTSLVDQIESPDKGRESYTLIRKCSAFYIQDEGNKWHRIMNVFKRSLEGRGSLIIPEYSRYLMVEALVTQVCLRQTEVQGTYSVHVPIDHTHTQVSLGYPLPAISGEALIDDADSELLAKIESKPWHAVQLFCSFGFPRDTDCWMLVDRCDPVARRIGLLRSSQSAGMLATQLEMSYLLPEKRVIIIE